MDRVRLVNAGGGKAAEGTAARTVMSREEAPRSGCGGASAPRRRRSRASFLGAGRRGDQVGRERDIGRGRPNGGGIRRSSSTRRAQMIVIEGGSSGEQLGDLEGQLETGLTDPLVNRGRVNRSSKVSPRETGQRAPFSVLTDVRCWQRRSPDHGHRSSLQRRARAEPREPWRFRRDASGAASPTYLSTKRRLSWRSD